MRVSEPVRSPRSAGKRLNEASPARRRTDKPRMPMDFDYTPKVKALETRLRAFMDEHVYPNEARYYADAQHDRWQPSALMEALKPKARAAGLWNLFLPASQHGAGLANVDYAP